MQTISNMLHFPCQEGRAIVFRFAPLHCEPVPGLGRAVVYNVVTWSGAYLSYPSVRDWTEAATGPKSSSPRLCTRTPQWLNICHFDCHRARSCVRHARRDVLEYCGTRSNVVECVQLEKRRPHIWCTFTAQIKYLVGTYIHIHTNTYNHTYSYIHICIMHNALCILHSMLDFSLIKSCDYIMNILDLAATEQRWW